MRLSNLLYFYRVRFRARRTQDLLALLGIAVGVALLFAALVASTSLTGSVERLVRGTVGEGKLQVSSRAPGGFDERTVDRVRRLPTVRSAAPLLEARATITGPGGQQNVTLLGVDRSFVRMAGPLLQRLKDSELPVTDSIALPDSIARDAGIILGGHTRLAIAGREPAQVRVVARLTDDDIGSLADTPIAVASIPYAQQLVGNRGRVTRIIVQPQPGKEALAESALRRIAGGALNVGPADSELALFRQAALPLDQSTTSFAAISALVGFLFAFNAMLLTLAERQRLIEDLRLDGFRPWRVAQVILFDALVLGVAASVVGLLLGDQLSRHLFQADPGYLSFAFPVGAERIVEWQDIAIAVAGGLLATALAAVIPLLSVLRRRPGSKPVPERRLRHKPMLVAALVCLAGSVPLLLLLPGAAILGLGLVVIALMLILPTALYGAFGIAWRLTQTKFTRSAVPIISVGELRAMHGRSVALAATGAIAVFGMVAIQGSRGDLQSGLDDAVRDLDSMADIWVTPAGSPNTLATTPFKEPANATELERLPGVKSVHRYRSSFLDIDSRRVWILAPPRESNAPVPASQLVDGELRTATDLVRSGGWAVVSKAVADEHGLDVGEHFTLPAPRPMSFRVAALSTNIGWAPGAILINADDYSRAWGSTAPSAYHIDLEPNASSERVRDAVARALSDAPALSVETAAQREDRQRDIGRQGLARLDQLAALMLIAAVLAMAAATAGMVWQRRARLAALKLDGFTDRTLWRALILESAILLSAGCLVGSLFGLYGQQLLDRTLVTVTGFPVVATFGAGIAVVSFAVVTAVAVLIAAIPGYVAARVPASASYQE